MALTGTLGTLINDARTFASETYANADKLISQAAGQVATGWPNSVDFDYSVPLENLTFEIDPVPDNNLRYTAPTKNIAKPTYFEINAPSLPPEFDEMPEFDESNLYEGLPPTFNVPDFTKTAPVVNAITLPDAPEVLTIPYPELREVTAPTFGGVTIPTFDPVLLADLPDAPENYSEAYEEVYKRALPEMKAFIDSTLDEFLNKYAPNYTSLREKLDAELIRVMDGGTALSDSIEQQIYERAKFRTEEETQRALDAAINQTARLGLYIPAGATTAAVFSAANTATIANAHTASETAIERAKIEIQNKQFVLTLANQINTTALTTAVQWANTMLQVNGQALEFAKQFVNSMVEFYNQLAQRFGMALELYKTQAQVYDTILKAAMADLEVYRIEAEVAKLTNDLNKTEVDLYIARVSAQESAIKVYATQVDAIATAVKAEATAVSAFGEEVSAYKTLVDAKSAEFDAYKAALEGNAIQAQIYSEKVNAYATKVNAEVSKQNMEVANNNSIISYNQNLTQQFAAELEAYKAEVSASSQVFDSEYKAYVSALDAYKTVLNAEIARVSQNAEVVKLELDSSKTRYETQMMFNVNATKVRLDSSKNVADVHMAGAAIYGNFVGSAIGAQNTIVQQAEEFDGTV